MCTREGLASPEITLLKVKRKGEFASHRAFGCLTGQLHLGGRPCLQPVMQKPTLRPPHQRNLGPKMSRMVLMVTNPA